MQIHLEDKDISIEYIKHNVDLPDLDIAIAKNIAKELARKKSSNPMILSWKNGITGDFYPKYGCGGEKKPIWIHYAEARGANLTIDINDGQYIFMILKL